MALSDALVKHDKPKSKAYTLNDNEGLALFVSPSGAKTCHFRFTLQGKWQRISLEVYSEVGLAQAKVQCESNRQISHVSVTAGVPFTHTIAGMSNASNLGRVQQEIHAFVIAVAFAFVRDNLDDMTASCVVSSSMESFADFNMR